MPCPRCAGLTGATAMAIRIHPTALVEDGVEIGDGTSVWDNVHIRAPSHIGRAVHHRREDLHRLRRADRRPRQDQRVRLRLQRRDDRDRRDDRGRHHLHQRPLSPGDDARSVRTCGIPVPTSTPIRRWCARGRRSAPARVIGSDLAIGRFAMVGMGAVVTRSVPDFHLALGHPARSVGLVCRCGEPLARWRETARSSRALTCDACGLAYDVARASDGDHTHGDRRSAGSKTSALRRMAFLGKRPQSYSPGDARPGGVGLMSTNGKPIASLSLDLDNQWSYMKTHGDPAWEAYPSYLDVVVPRVLRFLAERGLKITFFIVGQDARTAGNRPALAAITAAGHEVGNHSFRHEPWLHLYTDDEVEAEIARAEAAIMEATGQRPTGFRGPGFSISTTVLATLKRRGYRYDASTFPTFLGPLARAYYFFTAKLSKEEREQRKELFGGVREGFRPLRPYHWRLDDGPLLELPVTTMPLFRVPFHVSYLIYLAGFSPALARLYFATALTLCRLDRRAAVAAAASARLPRRGRRSRAVEVLSRHEHSVDDEARLDG